MAGHMYNGRETELLIPASSLEVLKIAVIFGADAVYIGGTVVDRVFQQAITQVLSPIYEKQFSKNSFGFRPNRGAHNALKQCQTNVNDGYVYVVDMDLEKFFDTVCQSKLIEVLSRTIKDGRVISLIHKYLNAGVISRGRFEKTEVGMPQGGPLSPLLSNIMLNELDKELTHRGHRFVPEGSERRTKKTGSCDGRKSRPLRRAPETPPA